MITVENLKKSFKVENPKLLSEQEKRDPRLKGRFFHSVQDVSFESKKGEVLALLGPNGAGKTTTLRVLSTALKADSGRVSIDGYDITDKPLESRKKMGFLSGSTGLYGRLTGRENIVYFAKLNGMKDSELEKRLAELTDMLEMSTFLDRRCEHFSTGMKQKTAIARAVIHQPEVVILDEPTTGLDIMAAQTVLNFIGHLKEANISVIFSTHHLEEVRQLCDRVVVVHQGLSVFDDTFEAFQKEGNGLLNDAFLSTLGHNQKERNESCG